MSLINCIYWSLKRKKFIKEYKEKVIEIEDLSEISDYKESSSATVEVCFYDVLDNKGFAKLINKLYKFKKKQDCSVDTIYRKKYFRKINYIYPQFDHTSTGIVGCIKFNKYNFIKEINICSTQINNEEALICYSFTFNSLIWDSKQITRFVKENIIELKRFKFTPIYSNVDEIVLDEREKLKINNNLFYFILQGYIVKEFFSSIGKNYQLPRLTRELLKEHSKEIDDYLKDPFLRRTYKLENEESYFVVDSLERPAGIEITEYMFGNTWSRENLLSIFSDFKMDAYLTFFYSIEVNLLESKISKFLNSNRRSISHKDYKWLLGKLRKVDEKFMYEIDKSDCYYKASNLIGYSKNCPEVFIQEKIVKEGFQRIYKNNIEYLSAIYSSNYNLTILITTVITLILTIFGLVA